MAVKKRIIQPKMKGKMPYKKKSTPLVSSIATYKKGASRGEITPAFEGGSAGKTGTAARIARRAAAERRMTRAQAKTNKRYRRKK